MKNTIIFFLGISLFMFGILKFVNPFKTWYQLQILNSGLGQASYWMGIIGEISIGFLLILALYFRKKLTKNQFSLTVIGASITIILIMITATIVHLNPAVPANVLPLKIKFPIIPTLFLFLAVFIIYSTIKGGTKPSI